MADILNGSMNIPGIGNVNKKYAVIGAAGVAGFVGYMYIRNRNAATTDEPADSTDPSTDFGSTFDPSTASDPSAYAGYYGDGSEPVYQSPINQTIPVTSSQQITTDAAWDSAIVEASGGLGSAEGNAMAGALGRYLAGSCLSSAQAELVRTAQGMYGRPPQSPNLNIAICPDGGTTGTQLAAPSGFRVSSTGAGKVCLAWSPLSGAMGYHIKIKGPGADHTVVTHNTSSYCVGSLHRKAKYSFYISAYSAAGTGKASSTLSATTK